MPAVTVDDVLVLPRVPAVDRALARERPVRSVTTAPQGLEGEGFPVRRAFAGVSVKDLDPFVHMDQMGEVEYAPGEPKGTAWHPHRGFETVTYMIDGVFDHQDSNGGGGRITNGDTQWMTAGGGILHIEAPPEATLLSSTDGGALVRVIAGEVGGHRGPGSTFTPMAMVHATVSPGAVLDLAWRHDFNALVYVLGGQGTVGAEARPIHTGQLAVFGPGDALTVTADARQEARFPALDVLVLGGQPIREPVVHYGPFVMNTKAEVLQALEDYQAGRLGRLPAERVPHHHPGDVDPTTGTATEPDPER
jgi:redox-sensitive bicupin YhaK (pirin superfamily)